MSKSTNEVRVEKIFNQPVKTVFEALSHGRLFICCGTAGDALKIDFRVGGWYSAPFANADLEVRGRFLEIVDGKKIRFTWGDDGSTEGIPKTEVAVELFSEGAKTRVQIVHTGFTKQSDVDSHSHGWNAGLGDLAGETDDGRLRIVRVYPVGREALYKACGDFRIFFAPVAMAGGAEVDFKVGGQFNLPTEKGGSVRGVFKEIVPGKKIAFTWNSTGCGVPLKHETLVTITFDDEDDGESSLELVHDGLTTPDAVKSHRGGWELIVSTMKTKLKHASLNP